MVLLHIEFVYISQLLLMVAVILRLSNFLTKITGLEDKEMDERHPKKYAPKKVFILEKGTYVEISYEELCERTKLNKEYASKLFLPLHGMLMEVTENVYREFYREERRQKYLDHLAEENDVLSYDKLTNDEFNGADVVIDQSMPVEDIVEAKIMQEKLKACLHHLDDDERSLIEALFFKGLSERQWSAISGVPQRTINRQKHRILMRLKKIIEKL